MGTIDTYVQDPLVEQNVFRAMPREEVALPAYAEARSLLPQPHWENHDSAIACYWKAWELAFASLRRPTAQNGFVANYVHSAMKDFVFMWDAAFMLHFGRYGRRAFSFQRTLDNLYAKQHPDGFICREIDEESGEDAFCRFDPASTGPNVMPWAEWEHFLHCRDRERLARVFPVLVAYHRWFREYRSWPDGTYWATGWSSGMDNQPRVPGGSSVHLSPAHLSWIDACLQQILSAKLLLAMGQVLGRGDDVADMRAESERLGHSVNQHMWDEASAFYYDRRPDGSLSRAKTVGAYWALLAGIVPPERLAGFIGHLQNPAEFARPDRVPSLPADDPHYDPAGGYWLGGVWPSTNYMILRGLSHVGAGSLAHEIGMQHVGNVVRVFEQTGTLWENYAPERAAPGKPAQRDFVGWGGLPPIAGLFEYVFGLQPDVASSQLAWNVTLLDAHSVSRYPFGSEGLLDLACARRTASSERPRVTAESNVPLELEIRWDGGVERVRLPGVERVPLPGRG